MRTMTKLKFAIENKSSLAKASFLNSGQSSHKQEEGECKYESVSEGEGEGEGEGERESLLT